MFVQKMKQNRVWLITGGGLLALLLLAGGAYFLYSRRNGGGGGGDKDAAGGVRNLRLENRAVLIRTRADEPGDDPTRVKRFGFAWDAPESGSDPLYYDLKYHYTLTLPDGEKVTDVTKSTFVIFPGSIPKEGMYQMVVYASNQIGDGPKSEIKHDLSLAPPAVGKISWDSSDHAIVWSPVASRDDPSAPVTYDVEIGGRPMGSVNIPRFVPPQMSNGSYDVAVRAFNKYGSAAITRETIVVRIFGINRIDAKWVPVEGESDTYRLAAFVDTVNKNPNDVITVTINQKDGKPLKFSPGGSCPTSFETSVGPCTASDTEGERCPVEGQLTFGPPKSSINKNDCSMLQFDANSLPGGAIQITATGKLSGSAFQPPSHMQTITLPGALPTAVRGLGLVRD